MALRILLLAPHPFFSLRGTPIAVRATVEVLAAEGHRLDLLTYHEGEDVQIEGVRVHRIPRPLLVGHVPIGPSWQKLVCDSVMMRHAFRMAARSRYDVVHAVEEASFFAWLVRLRRGIPYIYDMDSVLSQQVVDKGWPYRACAPAFRLLERRAVRDAIGVLAVCPAVAEVAELYAPGGVTTVLPDFALATDPAALAPPGLLDAPGRRLVYVGNLEAYQGIELMIDAFRLIPGEVAATLVIVGGTAESIGRQERYAGDLVRDGRVRFLGPSDLGQLMAICTQADILVSPRRLGQNTPMKVFNYMNSGRAILATRLPTHTQVLDDETALLVEPDPASMAAGMLRLIESETLRQELGSRALERVRQQYDEAAFRDRLLGFYRQVRDRVAPGRPAGGRATADPMLERLAARPRP